MRPFTVGIALVLLLVTPAGAAPEDVANEIASEVMSPYCDGVTLHDCPSSAAGDLRDQIEAWARQGWSKAQIIGELEDRFGNRIHATPQESEGLAAWVLPVVALLAGLGVVLAGVRKWTNRPEERVDVDPADHARVEQELARLRQETP